MSRHCEHYANACPYRIFSPLGVSSEVDIRLANNSEDVLIRSFRALTIKPDDLPLRPDFGTIGKVVKLRANFFPVKLPASPFFEYDVEITPTTGASARRVKRRIFQLAEQTSDWARAGLRGTTAHDHASKLISVKKLAQPLVINVGFIEEDEAGPPKKFYALTFNFTKELDNAALHK